MTNDHVNGAEMPFVDADLPQAEKGTEGSDDGISDRIRDSYDKVPSIGTRWRWYDIPYRVCSWLLTSWRRKIIPRRPRLMLNRVLNYFITFNELERARVLPLDSWMDNLLVPPSEHVRLGGLWVAELFPPSEIATFVSALERNGWDRSRRFNHEDVGNAERVRRSRSGAGWSWWNLAWILDVQSSWWVPDAQRERLPAGIAAIELKAVQLGSGLTAVIAFCHLSEDAATGLDREWHRHHEPHLEWRGWRRRPRMHNRQFAGIVATQEHRAALHGAARTWLAHRCPGFFAREGKNHLVMDLITFDDFDPTSDEADRDFGDCLRALGLGDFGLDNLMSPSWPALVFRPYQEREHAVSSLPTCWSIIGRRSVAAEAFKDQRKYRPTDDDARFIASVVDESVGGFVLMLAVQEMIRTYERLFAEIRDASNSSHKRFTVSAVESLRGQTLRLGLDIPSLTKDASEIWKPHWRQWLGVEVRAVSTPRETAYRKANGLPDVKSRDVLDDMRRAHKRSCRELERLDSQYRAVLSTTVELGSSIAATKLSRRALYIALASLGVAAVTLLMAQVAGVTLLQAIWAWLDPAGN